MRENAPELTCVGNIGVITDEERHTVRGPDLAVVRKELAENLHPSGFLRGAPDLAVEVVSPSNRASEFQEKVGEYLDAGASLVWVIYPGTHTVAVHASPEEARFLGEGDALMGSDLLPRLRVPVVEVFSG